MGYLQPTGAVRVFANCQKPDNAFFVKQPEGGGVLEFVCLGYSASTLGAQYWDDATVAIQAAARDDYGYVRCVA